MNIANNIKAQARLHGKTVTQIADELGVLQPQLSRTINNPRISLEDLARLAEAIGCRVADFFADDANLAAGPVSQPGVMVCPKCGARLNVTVPADGEA